MFMCYQRSDNNIAILIRSRKIMREMSVSKRNASEVTKGHDKSRLATSSNGSPHTDMCTQCTIREVPEVTKPPLLQF